MSIPDETLMAYADGELDPVTRDAVESAIREDPQLQRRLAQHRALRQQVQSAYAAELYEEVPQRLLAAVRGAAATPDAKAVSLARRGAADVSVVRTQTWRGRWAIPVSMAASVIAGVGLGFFMWGRESPLVQGAEGALVARGQLASALSNQLAADQSESSAVQMGVSFLAKSGDYCRTFTLPGAASPAGLACRRGKDWQIQALTPRAGSSGGSEYRTAASAMPEALLRSVEEQSAGEPLDQAGERAARASGWTTVDR
jgi:hypothetical protein